MDVNATRFHILLGEDDWRPLIKPDNGATLDLSETSTGLILKEKLFRFPAPPGDQPPSLKDRRGAARDRYGNWYWIAEDEREIRFLPPSDYQFQHFWAAEDLTEVSDETMGDFKPKGVQQVPPDLKLRGLAVTTHHYLVVGMQAPSGLLVFDLHAGGPPIQMLWPEEVPFHPFDMAPRSDGGIWILDIPPGHGSQDECRYWVLDRDFQVVGIDQQNVDLRLPKPDDFQPEGNGNRGVSGRKFPTGISLALATPLPEIRPLALEALPDDSVLIMAEEASHSVLYRYRYGQQLGQIDLKDIYSIDPDLESSDSFSLRGYDLAFVSDADAISGQLKGILYIAAADGNQVFAFHPTFQENDFSIALIKKYFPLRRFTGKALVAGGKGSYMGEGGVFYDLEDRWLPVVAHHKPRHEIEGVLVTASLDGKEPGCIWHRMIMDAKIPAGTTIEVASRAADSQELLEITSWQIEPSPYCRSRGSEIPYYAPFTHSEVQKDGVGCWELLLQNARGRYLQLRLTLRGTGRSTPQINAIRIYYPRFSYLTEYLPAVYQHDDQSASFLERFLANIEGMYTTLEGRIIEGQQLFDVRLLAREFLEWLATWLGVTLDPSWDERRQRLFINHAIELFRQRGTLSGLIRLIRLALDPCVDETLFHEDVTAYLLPATSSQRYPFNVRIVERYLLRSAPGVAYGDQTQPDIPRLTDTVEPWTPEQGASPLHLRFREYVEILFSDGDRLSAFLDEIQVASLSQLQLSPVLPENEAAAAVWRSFIQNEIGFTYAEITADDESDYQSFLKHRYRQIDSLNQAYQRNFSSFSTIPLPNEDDMPDSGPRLFDWIQFVSLAVLIRRYAHQFTVLIPIDPDTVSPPQVEQKMALVRRIVNLEKPSHTQYDVKPYWALFRVGEARVGLDTLLGRGSRFIALILGHAHLAEAYLGASHPWNVTDRIITGRDDLGSEMVL